MTDPTTPDEAPPPPAPVVETAGAMLAAARLAAGQSIEAIATQLKLAPRQVRALEEGDWAALPGRTFVRGFVRNYARLVHLDPQVVLAALPGEGAEPGLARPTIAAQHRAIGEIPVEANARRWTRWAIPLALLLVILVGVAYERLRPQNPLARDAVPAPAPAGSTAAPEAAREPADAPAGGMPLPNPVAAPADGTSTSPPADAPSSAPASGAAAPTGTTGAAAPALAAPAVSADAATAPALEIAFRGVSWVEVKDAKGASVLNMTGTPGASQAVRATPPLDIVVGNAPSVDVTFRGARVDLAPYTKQNIARLTLR
ncbi:MAG: DUF4115 domain-containing protein [Proteobacteria bacterium]|nr:DUF4115 domain-containing protein [Pseudomonadota bacterium]